MPKQTLEVRGRRAREERRRAEKALKRRLEGAEAAAAVEEAADILEGDASQVGEGALPDTGWRGLVAGVQRGGVLTVVVGGRTYGASLARELARDGYSLTVGDRVQAVLDTPGRVTIVDVEPRRTKLARVREDRSRRSAFAREEAVLAANVDVAVIVAAVADPPFHPKLVDRFLVICQYGGIRPILCLNKCDLVASPPDLSIYAGLGLPIVYASAATGTGLDDLRGLLAGTVAVFTGHSGVGKSSLVNALLGEEQQAVGTVGAGYRRGRHTTTSSSLLPLDDDSYLVDTPGVRSLGIWEINPRTLAAYFPDFDPIVPGCRFSTCSHVHEPACAVKEAVEDGEIARQRYESYLRLMEG